MVSELPGSEAVRTMPLMAWHTHCGERSYARCAEPTVAQRTCKLSEDRATVGRTLGGAGAATGGGSP